MDYLPPLILGKCPLKKYDLELLEQLYTIYHNFFYTHLFRERQNVESL